ncbi:HipA domain-containing protein [uncultured Limnobacter sp.]|uniref:type II toxin-antitoxin system HipA family toxin n=1 Tax=uncultured Limnobacter sp. TaxID=199681 RepID=UPI0030F7495B
MTSKANIENLVVFAHLNPEGFVPAGLLTMTETATQLLGSEFGYGRRYVQRSNRLEIDPVSLGLNNENAALDHIQLPAGNLPLFGGIRDAAPDSWGRRVIEAKLKVPANSLPESRYLLEAGSDRVGALEVRQSMDSPEILNPVPVSQLQYLLDAAQRIERGEPIPTALMPIFDAGTALGGARPKASVRETDDGLWLAKFPGVNDSALIPEIEAAALYMARQCGMRVPTTKIVLIGKQPVMLIERFDRYWSTATAGLDAERKEYRLGFNSALTFLGCTEQENGEKSYAAIAQAIHRYVAFKSITEDCEELFRRMVFNIFVTNDDDHLRNHGFIFSPESKGWRLSPLYDVMPRPTVTNSQTRHQSIGVGEQGTLSTLDNALTQCLRFRIQPNRACTLMNEVWTVIRQWKQHFEEFGVSAKAIDQATLAMRHIDDVASPELKRSVLKAD